MADKDFRIGLDALERIAHVPREEQVEEQSEPDTRPDLSGTDLPGNVRPFAAG